MANSAVRRVISTRAPLGGPLPGCFALEIEGDNGPIYSNEFAGIFKPEQSLVEQGDTPTGIMDPYVD